MQRSHYIPQPNAKMYNLCKECGHNRFGITWYGNNGKCGSYVGEVGEKPSLCGHICTDYRS